MQNYFGSGMPVNEKMVRKGTKVFCNDLITNTLSLRQPIAKGLVETVVGSNNAADFSASVANGGVGALHQGGNVGLVQSEQNQVTVIHVAVV